jgi:hypothetical protein
MQFESDAERQFCRAELNLPQQVAAIRACLARGRALGAQSWQTKVARNLAWTPSIREAVQSALGMRHAARQMAKKA